MKTLAPQALNLRDYQENLVQSLYEKIRKGQRHCLIVAGTGAGKTETATRIAMDVVNQGKRFTFLVHRDALVRNTYDRFRRYGLKPSIVAGGFPRLLNLDNPLQIASIQTLNFREEVAKEILSGVVLFDEAHSTLYTDIGRTYAHRARILLGLTATPWRLKKTESLHDFFGDQIVLAPIPRVLQEMGFLVPFRYYGLEGQVDTSNLGKGSDGDFKVKDLSVLTSTPAVVTSAVDNWERLAKGKRTIGFAVDVAHARAVTQEFQRRGIRAAMVHGGMSAETERQPLYDALASGELTVLMSCKTLTEGFDVPAVEAILELAPTLSKSKFFQEIGRGARISPATGKTECLVLDQAGNTQRHGFLEDLDESAFQLIPAREKKPPEPPPTKVCPGEPDMDQRCGAILNVFVKVCPHCGHEFPGTAQEAVGELVEFKPRYLQEKSYPPVIREYRQLKKEAFQKGIPPTVVLPEFRKRHPTAPRNRDPKWELGAVFGTRPKNQNVFGYFRYLESIRLRKLESRRQWSPEHVIAEFEMEFGAGSFAYYQKEMVLPCPYPHQIQTAIDYRHLG